MKKHKIPFGSIGCFVKMRGNRNKHIVILDEDTGFASPNLVVVKEVKSGEETETTWDYLREW